MLTATPTASQNPHNQGFYNATHTGNTGRAPGQASTLPVGRTSGENRGHGRQNSGGVNPYATANPALSRLPADEFGYSSTTATPTGRPTVTPINTGTNPSARPTSSRSMENRANRLTITNPHPSDMFSEESMGGSSRNQQPQRSQVDTPAKQWPSAEEEKRLYEQARRRVETTQGPHAAPVSSTIILSSAVLHRCAPGSALPSALTTTRRVGRWLRRRVLLCCSPLIPSEW